MLIITLLLALSASAHAADWSTSAQDRPPIRLNIRNCQTYLIPGDQTKDDSVGIPFSTNDILTFKEQLRVEIETRGIEAFRDAQFYVVGVAMKDEKSKKLAFDEVLQSFALQSVNARVSILSVPTEFVKRESVSLARRVLERTAYFFPSIKRDLQSPQLGEFTSSALSSALIEIPNAILLFQRMPEVDATLTATSHFIILTSLLIYEKSLINWLLRSGTKHDLSGRIEMFFKNMLVSMPFITSYNVFGQFSQITQFYAEHGWLKMAEAFPNELANFGATQGLTAFIQALFYSQVINRGFSAWVNRQVGEEQTRTARTLRPWLQFPVLVVSSALLAWSASGQADVLLTIGPMDVNSGHVALAGMTLAGGTLFTLAPKFLDPTLGLYQKMSRWLPRRPREKSN